jgi:hypothetical protein
MLVFLGLYGWWSTCSAQAQVGSADEGKIVATVSFAGYDALKRDAELIAQMVGQPDAIQGLEGMLNMMTQGKALASLDKARPWGVVVGLAGMQPSGYAFVPVTDLEQLVGLLAGLSGGQPPQAVDGVYEIDAEDEKVYAAQKGDWVFVSNQRELIDNPPADPVPLLGGLESKYVIGAQVIVKNVPQQVRDQLLMFIRMGAQMGQQQMPGETDEQYAIRKRMSEQGIQELEKAINELDTITIGLDVDQQTKSIGYDVTVTAIEGTSTAQEYAALADNSSNFGAFYDESAALTFHMASKMSASDVAQLKQYIATFRNDALKDIQNQALSDQEKSVATKMVNDLIDVVDATMESGRMDAALSVLFESNALTIISGLHIAGGGKLDQVVKQLATMVMQEQPELAQLVKLDADKHGGATFHTLTLPAEALGPDGPPPELFGGTLTVALGIGEENIYLGLGAGALDALKQAIDGSQAPSAGQPTPPFRLSLSASAIGALIEASTPAEELGPAQAVIGALKQAGSNDHIKVTSSVVPNGVSVRLEVEEGIIQVIGAAVAMVKDAFGAGVSVE